MTAPVKRTLESLGATFGDRQVGADARKRLVRDVFDRVAPRYDVMNDLMSLGLHRLWKRAAAEATLRAAHSLPGPIIDLAGGTGDLSHLMSAKLPRRSIINIDASPGMLAIAARRPSATIALVVGEGERLPLTNASAAAVALGFGLRNMTDPQRALRDVHRVLRPGGSLVLLEFSEPKAWFRTVYRVYSRYVIPTLGALMAGDRRSYRYLVQSIQRFPDVEAMKEELFNAGFADVTVRRMMFGVAALHVAVKG